MVLYLSEAPRLRRVVRENSIGSPLKRLYSSTGKHPPNMRCSLQQAYFWIMRNPFQFVAGRDCSRQPCSLVEGERDVDSCTMDTHTEMTAGISRSSFTTLYTTSSTPPGGTPCPDLWNKETSITWSVLNWASQNLEGKFCSLLRWELLRYLSSCHCGCSVSSLKKGRNMLRGFAITATASEM